MCIERNIKTMEMNALRMGTSPVGRLILSMSLPAIFSMLVQAMYNIIDSIFIARISEAALTGVTLIFPVNMFIIAVSVGTGVGVNSLISRRLGERKYEEAGMVASQSYRLAFISGIIFLILGLFFSRTFVEFFSDNPEIIENAVIYCQIVTMFSIFIMIQINNDRILQAQGNMLVPMVTNLVGATVHIILAYFLVFGKWIFPEWGVAGAAIATIIGQGTGVLLGSLYIYKKNHLIRIRIRGFQMDWGVIRDIYSVGFPSILMQSLASLMLLAVNGILIGFSEAAVAVMGVYFRTQSFVFMPVFGLNQGIMPIIGYNYGAKNKDRIMKTYWLSLMMAGAFMGIGTILFQLGPHYILELFNASSEMLRIGEPALRIISIGFLPAAFSIICSVLFQGIGHGIYSLVVSLARQLIGLLPLAFALSFLWGITGVWWAFPAAEFIGMAASGVLVYRTYVRELSSLDSESIKTKS